MNVKGEVLAAGAVVWRTEAEDVEIVLVHRAHYDDWSLPKGKLDPGESPLEAAIREVKEETGVTVGSPTYLGETTYPLSNEIVKRVHYWVMKAHGASPFETSDEIDAISWLPIAKAIIRLSYEGDKEILSLATPHLLSGDRRIELPRD